MIGQKLGRYLILEELGQGGLATVWKARDELMSRMVAIKMLAPRWAGSPDVAHRFRHEATNTAALDHPGIVAALDRGEADGVPYIVLSYVDGVALSDLIRQALLPIPEAIRIVTDVAGALAYAHDQRVIHRDVTSRNIMVARDQRVYVLDFGLALAAWESRLTTTGNPMGTAPYIPPEVLQGRDADERSDVYSLGIVLYEALTGAFPFGNGSSAAQFQQALAGEAISAKVRRPEIPAELDAMIRHAIARDPAERFETMAAMRTALLGLRTLDAAAVASSRPLAAPSAADSPAGRPDPLYLAILPFEQTGSSESGAALERLGKRLELAIRTAVAGAPGVRVVTTPAAVTGESADADALVRQWGANGYVRGMVSQEGTQLRVSFALMDAARGVQFGGGRVDGSTQRPFDVEDEFVAELRGVLGLTRLGEVPVRASRPPNPARAEHLDLALSALKRYDNAASVDGAIQLLEELALSEEHDPGVCAALGRAYLYKYRGTRQRVWEARAASTIEQALQVGPDAAAVWLALGDLQTEAGAHAAAIAEYQRVLERQPKSLDALLGLARARHASGQGDAAEKAARAAIAAAPSDWRGHNVLGEILFHRGDFRAAVDAWRRVVALTPDNATGHCNLGSGYYGLDRFDDAVEAYRQSIAIQPNAFAFTNLGTLLYFLGSFEESAAAFRKGALLRPADPLLWGNLAHACRWVPGLEEESAQALDRAIDLAHEKLDRNPSDSRLWAHLAEFLARRDRAPEARRAIARALQIAPDDLNVMVRAAHMHVDLGETMKGLEWIEKAVEHGHPVTEFRRSRALEPLRGDPEFERILRRQARAETASRAPGEKEGPM